MYVYGLIFIVLIKLIISVHIGMYVCVYRKYVCIYLESCFCFGLMKFILISESEEFFYSERLL